MISTIADWDKKIVGIVEWRQVAESGFDKPHGELIWVQNLWIHPDFRGKRVLEKLIADILISAPEAKWGYFTREKYGDRMSRRFSRKYVEALVKKELEEYV